LFKEILTDSCPGRVQGVSQATSLEDSLNVGDLLRYGYVACSDLIGIVG